MSAPIVPQRPARSQEPQSSNASLDVPQVPPRPARRTDSPEDPRISASRSPLNDSPFAANVRSSGGPSRPTNRLSKPPSVASLPLVGQEGMEYASLDQQPSEGATANTAPPEAPNETRNISGDLPMHAPKASMTSAAAREQVAPVTRIDSNDAARVGVGKVSSDHDDSELPSRVREYRPSSSLSREVTRTSSRPESLHGDEHDHGIPHIGIHVPMYPNAGDVQAPSPGPGSGLPATGVGFFNSGGSSPYPQGRRRSHQGFIVPPGSYGLHGHGLINQDQFEKAWYQKHPEELSKEEIGAHGPGTAPAVKPEWALSSEDLNRIVRDTANRQVNGGPPLDEDFGYKLHDEISSRNASRDASPVLKAVKSRTTSQTYSESPLKKASLPGDVDHAHAFDSENEDDVQLGPTWKSSTPALASDEAAKGSPWAKPAVSPAPDQDRGDDYFGAAGNRSPTTTRSKGKPRPLSARYHHEYESTGTHLDEIEEYEPLFKDEDDSEQRPLTAAERRKFPSLDIWEDTPTSLQLHTTVTGPQEPDEAPQSASREAPAFESPDKEKARKGETTDAQQESRLQESSKPSAKPKFKPGVEESVAAARPGQRRFPSLDIWEDTPSSSLYTTTVGEAQSREPDSATGDDGSDANNSIHTAPSVPARPTRSKELSPTENQPSVPPRPQRVKPQIPPRPAKTSQEGSSEGSPLTKSTSAGSTGSNEVASSTDRSVTSPTSAKAKPTVPSKPQAGSSKFASIKAGFMNDLNSRLQQGPQAKKAEPAEAPQEEEKAPLSDARKARAKGPARRKPADQSPSAPSNKASSGWSIVQPMNTWSISNTDGDDVIIGAPISSTAAAAAAASSNSASAEEKKPIPKAARPQLDSLPSQEFKEAQFKDDEYLAPVSPLATNTAGETLSKDMEVTAANPDPPKPDPEKDARAAAEEQEQLAKLKPHIERSVAGPEEDDVEPLVEPAQPLE